MLSSQAKTILRYLLIIVFALIFLVPFYIMLRNAIVSDRQILSPRTTWLPWPMQIVKNLVELFSRTDVNILSGLRNSTIIAVTSTFFLILFAAMAGYALARIPVRWQKPVFSFILVTMMVPPLAIFIPTYMVVFKLRMVNTFQGIILPGLFSPFATIMFRQFFLDFPQEIEESGRIDGLGYFGIFWRLVLPNSINILVPLTAITFLWSWNDFLWPLIVGQDSSMWTVQVSLSVFLTAQRIILHQIFMGGVVALLPTLIVFLVLQRYITRGIMFSGVKG